ncbi:hypothetical protein ACWCQK_42415 [Streptomyces sp. NPDC002306]
MLRQILESDETLLRETPPISERLDGFGGYAAWIGKWAGAGSLKIPLLNLSIPYNSRCECQPDDSSVLSMRVRKEFGGLVSYEENALLAIDPADGSIVGPHVTILNWREHKKLELEGSEVAKSSTSFIDGLTEACQIEKRSGGELTFRRSLSRAANISLFDFEENLRRDSLRNGDDGGIAELSGAWSGEGRCRFPSLQSSIAYTVRLKCEKSANGLHWIMRKSLPWGTYYEEEAFTAIIPEKRLLEMNLAIRVTTKHYHKYAGRGESGFAAEITTRPLGEIEVAENIAGELRSEKMHFRQEYGFQVK